MPRLVTLGVEFRLPGTSVPTTWLHVLAVENGASSALQEQWHIWSRVAARNWSRTGHISRFLTPKPPVLDSKDAVFLDVGLSPFPLVILDQTAFKHEIGFLRSILHLLALLEMWPRKCRGQERAQRQILNFVSQHKQTQSFLRPMLTDGYGSNVGENDKPYQCTACDRTFAKLSSLLAHRQDRHGQVLRAIAFWALLCIFTSRSPASSHLTSQLWFSIAGHSL